VIYWSKADTRYTGVNVTGLSSEEATLQNLRPYTSYLVAVRLRCSEGRVGVASPAFSFNTEAAGEMLNCVCVTDVLAFLCQDVVMPET
jgi:hypothetical protein